MFFMTKWKCTGKTWHTRTTQVILSNILCNCACRWIYSSGEHYASAMFHYCPPSYHLWWGWEWRCLTGYHGAILTSCSTGAACLPWAWAASFSSETTTTRHIHFPVMLALVAVTLCQCSTITMSCEWDGLGLSSFQVTSFWFFQAPWLPCSVRKRRPYSLPCPHLIDCISSPSTAPAWLCKVSPYCSSPC